MIEREIFNPAIMNDRDEGKAERIPYQWWRNIVSLYRRAPNKEMFIRAMKEGGISINGENITPIDFFSSSSELSKEEMKESIEAYLGINNLENNIKIFNQALEASRKYIEEYRHKSLPRKIKNIRIKSVEDILRIFKKTATLKHNQSLGFSPAYCDLVKTIAAEFEYKKKELINLINESKYVYEKMFDEDKEGIRYFHILKKGYEEYDRIGIFDNYNNQWINAFSYFRGKSENSFVSKFLVKAEATAEEAAKDGIGLKFEVETIDEVKKLAPFLVGYFEKVFSAKNFVLENTRLLKEDEILEIKKRVAQIHLLNIKDKIKELERDKVKNEKNIEILKNELEQCPQNPQNAITIKEDDNEYSNPNFQALKIAEGKLMVPQNGQDGNTTVSRRFEIQIVLTNNKNESGFSNHNIYEASKKLAIETRNVGSFTQKYLDIIRQEASNRSDLSASQIEQYFKKNFLKEIVVSGKKGKTTRYVVKKVALKLINAEMFPKTVKIKERK